MVWLTVIAVVKAPLHIALFCKPPIAGQVKTRLIPAYGSDGAMRIYLQLAERTMETVRAACATMGAEASLWVAGDTSHPAVPGWAERFSLPVAQQGAGDLGAKMLDCLATLATTSECVLLVGTDCPALDVDHLQTAAAALTGDCHWVFTPAEDGGYVLVGSNRPSEEPFCGIDWSTASVMAQTRSALLARELAWQETGTLWDVDEAVDVKRALAAGLLDSH